MRPTTLAALAILFAASPSLAQNPVVDMTLWTEEHINGAGPWTVDAPHQFCNSTNSAITDVSTFYSDFQVDFLEFVMRIGPEGGDDDLAGFILGWAPGDGSNPTTADYVLVDWKRATQAYQNWGTAQVGLALSHMQGQFTPGYANAPIDLWSHTGNCTELQRGFQYGNVGWSFGVEYAFRVVYTPVAVDIWIDNQLEFSVTGTFNPGRFACYNYSQSRTEFQFPLPGAFGIVGTGCAGSAGTPYLFAPTAPYVGEDLPVVVANLPPLAFCFLALGASDTNWNGIPLPVGLAPLGAPGCTAYNSLDGLLVMTNYNGTGFVFLSLPATLVPGTMPELFVQALATDPGANTLGLVLSNGGALTLGIR